MKTIDQILEQYEQESSGFESYYVVSDVKEALKQFGLEVLNAVRIKMIHGATQHLDYEVKDYLEEGNVQDLYHGPYTAHLNVPDLIKQIEQQ